MAGDETDLGGPLQRFETTSWSLLKRLRGPSADRSRALTRLAESYWKPVYCLIRHGWKRPNEDAKDLTQEFFATVLMEGPLLERYRPERGGFRSFLKSAVGNFMKDQAKHAGRQKRGGGGVVVEIPVREIDVHRLVPRAEDLTPDRLFDLAWQSEVLSRGIAALERRLSSQGKSRAFEVFRRYDLRPEGEEPSYRSVGEAVGLGPDDVKNELTLARREFRASVIEVVSDYVDTTADLELELEALLGSAGE